MSKLMVATLCVILLYTNTVQAGCYRNGRVKPTRLAEELQLNHSPAPQLDRHRLPKSFNWCVLGDAFWFLCSARACGADWGATTTTR